ncbi:Na+/H+ antiporter NhaC family protein [Aureibacillus halotolerans]|uniref:Transporter (NhaC family) n=1 Tax=Aureibacillus halotolerans TaxID=1508390 RepID=A0A4R6U2Q0_9BACI|nr:Na+/H+ antiporter NhaC family protein [Aureibacillus halotolerans]TDQ37394.1 transporter (NhaC family) [Aureibacillus halotolerans]
MEGTWISLLPFLAVIVVAVLTKQVLPGLGAGLLTASYFLTPHWLGGFETAIGFIIKGLQDENNLKIIVFLYLFAGMVGMIKRAGGIKGFVKEASNRIGSRKGALALTWISATGTFSAPSFRIVTVAPIMRALLKRVKMTPQELAFAIETTASPFIVLVPIATAFVGYMTSVIDISLHNEGLTQDPYQLYLQSIPFNFFSFSMIAIGFYLSFFHHGKASATKAGGEEPDDQWEGCHPSVAKDLPEKPLNLLIPLAVVLFLTVFLTYLDGVAQGFQGFQAFIEADVLTAMVLALVLSVLLSMILFRFQAFKLSALIAALIEGGNEVMNVVLLLAVVWALADATGAMGFSTFVTNNVGWIPVAFVPPVLFLLGAFISYFIGSSWGTWGILMPLGVSLAQVSDVSLPLVVGAVFASGTFGAFASPLSDDTNTTSVILGMNTIAYARFKLVPAISAAAVAAVLYLIVPFLMG